MTHARHERLTRYAAAASVVSLGSIGTADIIHFATPIQAAVFDLIHSSVQYGQTDQGATAFNIHASNWEGGQYAEFEAQYAVRSTSAYGYRSIARLVMGDVVGPSNVEMAEELGDSFPSAGPFYTLFTYRNPGWTETWPGNSGNFPATFGNWRGQGERSHGYVGFRFSADGEEYYSWAELQLVRNGLELSLKVLQWAYDDTGAAITAGDTGATAVPGAGGLVALACGAAGLRRRRRKPATTPETTETA